jgi:signal transduction histidine kinase
MSLPLCAGRRLALGPVSQVEETAVRQLCRSDTFWILVVIASTLFAFVLDRTLWPDRVAITLYMVPVLLASLRWFPSAVLAATIGTLAVAILDLYLEQHVTLEDAASLLALTAVGIMGMLHAMHRERLCRKAQRQREVISTVERMRQPLTVILGYTSYLGAKFASDDALNRRLVAIQNAANCLRDILDDIMGKADTV